jgi:thiamine kinase-like enzyme
MSGSPPAEVLRALEAGLGPAESEPVPVEGGITNRNWRVRVGGHDCVLRLPGKDTGLLGIDREVERAATEAAAAVGVGPDVVTFLPELGCLVTAWIEGRHVTADELRGPLLGEVGATLRTIHTARSGTATFSPFDRCRRYAETAVSRGGRLPEGHARVSAAADEIEAALAGRPQRPCHNDLLTANWIHDGTRLRIVDWEYAGMNDPAFDLGNVAGHHDLDADGERALLEAYTGAAATAGDLAALRLMRLMAAFWEAMWGVLQSTVSELDFDFERYAAEYLARLGASIDNPDYPTWLEDARADRSLPA